MITRFSFGGRGGETIGPFFDLEVVMTGKSKIGSPTTLEKRFWAKVKKTEGCWEWTGNTLSNGYGQIDQMGAHRVAWSLKNGPIPFGMFVCHKCDNPSCVRVDHLFLGSPKDNTADMLQKGRHPHGVEIGTNKLTKAQIESIRSEYASGASQTSLAKKYGVGQPHISSIVRKAAWKWAS